MFCYVCEREMSRYQLNIDFIALKLKVFLIHIEIFTTSFETGTGFKIACITELVTVKILMFFKIEIIFKKNPVETEVYLNLFRTKILPLKLHSFSNLDSKPTPRPHISELIRYFLTETKNKHKILKSLFNSL